MNIIAIRLRNFRGFQDASIELKPLTVLLGPNSAGKSSFGHALAAMAHAHRLYAAGAPGPVSLTPTVDYADTWPVDLGKTSDLRTVGEEGPVNIDLVTRAGIIELGFGGLDQVTPDLWFSHVVHPSGEQSASTVAPTDTTLLRPPDAQSGVIPAPRDATIPASPRDATIPEIRPPIKLKRLNEQQWQEETTEVSVVLRGLSVLGVQHQTGTPRVLSGAARDSLVSLLENLTYLRATRKRPSRGYRDDLGKPQPIGYSGEWTPSILLRRGPDQVTDCVPPQIPKSTDEARTIDDKWKTNEETLLAALGAWLSRIELANRVETVPPSPKDTSVKMRVTLENQAAHDITEIGFGVSQVIPVLVAGLLQPKDSLFIVDLPEAHLHPRPQGAIADFFCSLAMSGRLALVETHSEMFFHRLRLRAAMDPSLMDKIAVYFIDPPKDGICSNPRPVGLRYEDELRWPEQFLQEAYETEIQINAVRQAREPRS